ncbi:hypothetical protein ABZP36_013461 [Zizania latifolia]
MSMPKRFLFLKNALVGNDFVVNAGDISHHKVPQRPQASTPAVPNFQLAYLGSCELKFPQDIAEELQKLSSTLSTIQAHVEDAEAQQLKDKAARSWLAKLKDVAYDMDDILDEYAAEALQSKLEGTSNNHHLKKVRNSFCCLWSNNCSSFNHKILQQIRKIEEKIDRLVKERQVIGPNMISTTDREEKKERANTSSLIDSSSVFGREEDKEIIVNMLLSPNNSNHVNLSVLPIVGMGGLGKTTLTQLIYNDARVKEYFQLQVWICVCENFDVMKLSKETVDSVASGLSSATTTNMNLLQEDLSKKLEGKRFLLTPGRGTMEELGSSYFDELLSRSFFQHHKRGYVMHDAMHDLAQSVSIDECLRLDNTQNRSRPARSARHLSFSCDNRSRTSFEAFLGFKRARTLLLLNGYKSMTSSIPSDLFLKLRYLRVLDLNRRDITELPDSVGNLKMLRYLNLSGTDITMLPSSIGRLFSLHTLKLENCRELVDLPESITNLVNLRWLQARIELITDIARIGNLTCLQQLEEFVVRKDKGYKINELKTMMDITGRICIKNLENVASAEEAGEALLRKKTHINTLDLIWSDRRHSSDEANQDKEILEQLQPHCELRELMVKAFAGFYFPNWLSRLSHLQTIHLFDCTNCSILPALGELPLLKFLYIGGFPAIIQISQEFSGSNEAKGFPSLKELTFVDMANLKMWVSAQDGELLPSLTELEVAYCPQVTELPPLPPTLVKLRISETGFTVIPKVHAPSCEFSSSLACLQIHQCPNLVSLQEGLLTQKLLALQQLTITKCEELTHLPIEGFRSLTALKSLHIYDCQMLASSGQRSLLPPMLEDLRISSCSNLINDLLQEINELSSLKHLTITNCASFCSFPVKLPPTLQILEIFDCSNLGYLPADLEEALCLTAMTILKCPLIPCLPEHGLPESLKELYIRECPFITQRCQENSGEDWPKIAHVPVIEISDDGFIPNWNIRRRLP